MATKSGHEEPEKAEVVEDMLDTLDTAIDRVKVLYEQYFLGIQKQPPTFLHTDVERQIREITQLQVRNTALRYRFATLQQKFGAYHAYWRRTLRQIENGTYMRNLSKIGRHAARTGAEIPEEILAAMPKRMREQVKRDREAALALAELRHRAPEDLELLTLADETIEDQMLAAIVQESRDRATSGAHEIDDADADFDVDAFFAAITNEEARGEAAAPAAPAAPATPAVTDIDAPVIRWRRPAPSAEPGSPAIADAAGNRSPGTESSSLDPPTVRRPSTDQPGTERPALRRPSTDRPGAERPTLRRPSTERPGTERPTLRRPSTERPGTEQPSARRPSTERPGTEQPPARRPSTDPSFPGRPGTDRPDGERPSTGRANPRLPTVRPPVPDAEPMESGAPSTDGPSIRRPGTGRTNPRLPTVRPPLPDAEPMESGAPDAAWPIAGPADPTQPPVWPPSPAPQVEQPPMRLSTSAPSAGRLNIGPPGSVPPTVRLTGPGAGRPKIGRPSSAPSSSEPPVAEAPAAGLPDASLPDAGQQSPGAEQPAGEPSSTGAREPVSTERPAVIKLKIVQSNTALPTVRLLRPQAGRSGTAPASLGGAPASAEPPGGVVRSLERSDAQLNIGPLSDDLPTARMLSLSGAGSPADLPSAGPPSPGGMIDDQSTARLLIPVDGRWSAGPTAELPSTGQPSLAQLADDQSTARLWSALRPDTGPAGSSPAIAGPPGGGAEPPSSGAPRPPAPPPGGRFMPPRVVPPPIRPAPAHASPQPSGPPPAQPVRPEPPRLPAPSGPFPRIPIPPPIPTKARPASGAPPAAGERPASPERPPPIPAASRATPVRPGSAPPRPPPPPLLPRAAADRRAPEPRQAPPPGMSDAEVNALYAKYIQAKRTLGEDAGPDAYGKLLKTIHAQAPKIMEQYKATGVDFSVVVKDNQVIIRAKPKP